jgi:hypothetical protein
MSENTDKKDEDKEVRRAKLIEQLRVEENVGFFLNSILEPTLHLPGDAFQKDWPVDSQRVSDLVVAAYYADNEAILSAGEREFILSQIREECRAGGRRASETEATQTEKDVIVQGVLYLMNQQPEFDDQTCVLLGKLRTNQLQGKTAQHEEIPAFTNIFSRRLRRLVPVLRGYGVEVGMRHQEDGSYCKLVRLDAFQREGDSTTTLAKTADDENRQPSGEPSGGIPKKGKEFKKADATDGENRFDDPKDKEALNGRRTELAAAGEKGGAQ